MQTPEGLIELLTLKQLDPHRFEGENYKPVWQRVYGGQVLAQALHAANQTVPEDRMVHSLHGYFILPGDVNTTITYQVEALRDGGSFTTRRVTAYQRQGYFCVSCFFSNSTRSPRSTYRVSSG